MSAGEALLIECELTVVLRPLQHGRGEGLGAGVVLLHGQDDRVLEHLVGILVAVRQQRNELRAKRVEGRFVAARGRRLEVDELEAMVKNGLAYETQTTSPTQRTATTRMYAPKNSRSRIILLLALTIALGLSIWLIWRWVQN